MIIWLSINLVLDFSPFSESSQKTLPLSREMLTFPLVIILTSHNSCKHHTEILPIYYFLIVRNNKKEKQFDICIYMCCSFLPKTLFLLDNIQYSFLCLSSLPIIKVSPGSFQTNRHPLRHSPGLCSIWACPHEGNESFWEGQHVFPNVEDDQPKQWIWK